MNSWDSRYEKISKNKTLVYRMALSIRHDMLCWQCIACILAHLRVLWIWTSPLYIRSIRIKLFGSQQQSLARLHECSGTPATIVMAGTLNNWSLCQKGWKLGQLFLWSLCQIWYITACCVLGFFLEPVCIRNTVAALKPCHYSPCLYIYLLELTNNVDRNMFFCSKLYL